MLKERSNPCRLARPIGGFLPGSQQLVRAAGALGLAPDPLIGAGGITGQGVQGQLSAPRVDAIAHGPHLVRGQVVEDPVQGLAPPMHQAANAGLSDRHPPRGPSSFATLIPPQTPDS